jgi:class 3 adenylate cyclase/HAMP domain-containing protein
LGEKAPRRRWRLPIWLVLALAFGGLTTATATVIGVLFYVAARDNARKLTLDLGDAELSRISSTVNAQLQPAADQARFLADYISRGRVSPGDNRRLQDLLLGSIGAVRQLAGVGFVRPDLTMIRATAIAQGRSYVAEMLDLSGNAAIAAMMQQAKTTRVPFWAGPLRFAEDDGELLLVAVAPVSGENNRFMGIIGAAVSLRAASTRLAAIAGGGRRVPFVVTDAGRIIMHSSLEIGEILTDSKAALPQISDGFDPVLAAMPWPPRDMIDADIENRPPNVGVAEATVGDTDYFVIFRHIDGFGDTPWYIGYHVKQSWADDILETVNSVIPFAALMIGIAILIAFFLGRAIGKPIHEFANISRRIAQMDLDVKPSKGSRITEFDMASEAQGAMRNGLVWLSNYIPRTLAPVLLQSGEAMVSREANIVVMFTDIVGFSGIAEGRDADKLAALLNRHFALLGAVIEEQGGTIDKYIGDSIMAFWGAPLDQEDRAERAIRAAVAIARKLQADNARRARKGLKPIRIRMGLHQGPALVGNIGAPGRVNYTLVGDTVNVAQRLEQFGREVDDGSVDAVIVISAELAGNMPEGVVSVDLGEHSLPGRSSAEHLYQIRPE